MAIHANSTPMLGRLSPGRTATMADLEAEFVMLSVLRDRTMARLSELTLKLWAAYGLPDARQANRHPMISVEPETPTVSVSQRSGVPAQTVDICLRSPLPISAMAKAASSKHEGGGTVYPLRSSSGFAQAAPGVSNLGETHHA